MPLPHTISDFWQLVVEQGCQAIVMLNDMDSEDEVRFNSFHNRLCLENASDRLI